MLSFKGLVDYIKYSKCQSLVVYFVIDIGIPIADKLPVVHNFKKDLSERC